eukprot:TRINITY_DN17841_c0_g1_i1.p1 TRINITY_DN17841_c0_g1~~TRINITY_DN17841_c0_g1_i1.p1  ORF type:complete len:622 (+),score=112.63 TRINITY_DN17841_c0_g1_i1:99-1964(+)
MEPIDEFEEEDEETEETESEEELYGTRLVPAMVVVQRPLPKPVQKPRSVGLRIRRSKGVRICGILFLVVCVTFGLMLSHEIMDNGRDFRIKPDECTHPVYCTGELLRSIQLSGIFNDSKTFVDMPIKTTVPTVLAEFNALTNKSDPVALKALLSRNFLPAGWDVHPYTPPDWNPNPAFLDNIADPAMRSFALSVHRIWKDLSKVYDHKGLCPECYSSVPLPNAFIVPGGRFREFYYWDTYWILEGLYVSGMFKTARGIIINFVTLIEKYGFFPNGARIYYLNRSQPPLFSSMVERYIGVTGDVSLLAEALDAATKEMNWWLQEKNRVKVDGHVLNYYHVEVNGPRPESYLEDVETVKGVNGSDDIRRIWSGLASAAESGWDFSSRWMRVPSTDLRSISTASVVPVDLNVFIYKGLDLVARWSKLRNDTEGYELYSTLRDLRREAIQDILWDGSSHQWKDYNLTSQRLSQQRYPSNFTPLWAGLMPPGGNTDATLAEIERTILVGGIPTSYDPTGQQWDMPNAWAPLQYIIITGVLNTNTVKGAQIAQKLSGVWLASNYCGWNMTGGSKEGLLFEKYNASHPGVPGSGGEYNVQEGFGWTNGVVLSLLMNYRNTAAPVSCQY